MSYYLRVRDLREGDLVETNEGFHLIVGLKKDSLWIRVYVYSLVPAARRTGTNFQWNSSLPLYDPKWDGSTRWILRFYRDGERLK